MDALKTKRKSLRTSFTATANKLKECLAKKEDAKDGDKLRALNSQLQDKFLRLDDIQNKISPLLLEITDTVAEYETDFQAEEDYRDNFLELKYTIEMLLNKDSGSILESSSELDVVVEQLKLRFGREDLLVKIYVRDLHSLFLKSATTGKNAPDLAPLYDMLKTKLRALESLGGTKEKFAEILEPLVESCLPENVLRAWERSRISESTDDAISQRSLEKLMRLLRHEVESEEMIRLAREGFGKDRGGGVIRKECQKSVHKDEPTAATLISNLRKEKESNFSSKDRTADNEQRPTETLLTNLLAEHEIYLKTIMIRLRNRDKEVCVRALLDDGSQRSYIEKNLAAELFLSSSGRDIFSRTVWLGNFPCF
ncbi:DUF1758 domain-containing protein [Nephila pilipes]|uniref:DUF1758 domain-containing protein n=1 Tax=Nephila pilipes TaxID=299642 RepID=A0A8X6PQ00_NEPPI|nr:DUF1758 domain-containing protein [Nephila pilipes]